MKEALIVIDMCRDFVADDGKLTVGKPAQLIVPYILEECEKTIVAGGEVFFPTDLHLGGHDGKWPPHCDPDTDGFELYGQLLDLLDKRRHTHYIPKKQYNCFHGTTFRGSREIYFTEILKENEIYKKTPLKFCGVCTDICILHSVAGAYFEGFTNLKVLKRGCATFSANSEIAFEMMKNQFFAEIVE